MGLKNPNKTSNLIYNHDYNIYKPKEVVVNGGIVSIVHDNIVFRLSITTRKFKHIQWKVNVS